MNSFSKSFIQTALLFLYANAVNIIFFISHLTTVVVLRPIVIYEYFLIAIFILLRFPPVITWLFWVLIMMLDLLNSVSAIFLFNLSEFLNNLEFTLHYSLSFRQYLLLFLFGVFLYFNFWLIQKLSRMEVERRMLLGGFFAACIVVVFSLDFLNGSSRLANHREKIAITQFNLGGSVLNLSVILLADLVSVTPKPVSISKSVTHQTFAYDSTGNQIMILIESWGLPSKNQKLKMIQNSIKEAALQQGWNAEFGSTGFEGSTTNAEMRELLSARGNFRYLLNKDSASRLESIFTIKKKQGFTTIAAHSFSGKMFWRIGWWRNIGIDSAFFLEDIVKRNKLNTNSLNYETPFASVNDEDVYLFVAGIPAAESRKKFVYFLSENSHLPYREQPRANKGLFRSTPLSFPGELSVEADNQLKRIQGLIFYILESPQSKQWSKVLIMGDHMPPFTNNTDRQFYSSTEVPYFILYR